MEKSESSYTAGGNVNWHSHFGRVWQFLEWLNIELLHDFSNSAARYRLNRNENIQTETCMGKQPQCPSTDEWINTVCYIHKWNITWPWKEMKYGYMLCMNECWKVKKVLSRWSHIMWSHFSEMARTQKSVETESSLVVAHG